MVNLNKAKDKLLVLIHQHKKILSMLLAIGLILLLMIIIFFSWNQFTAGEKQSNKVDFKQKLLKELKKEGISIYNNKISIVIGSTVNKIALMDQVYTEYIVDVVSVENDSPQDNLQQVDILKIQEIVLISVVEQNDFEQTRSASLDLLLEVLTELSSSRRCMNNIIVLKNHRALHEKTENKALVSQITQISNFVMLNIPVYVIVDALSDIPGFKSFLEFIDQQKFFHMVGLFQKDYVTGHITSEIFVNQKEYLVNTLDSYIDQAIRSEPDGKNVCDMLMIPQRVGDAAMDAAEVLEVWSKSVHSSNLPVFRGILITGRYKSTEKQELVFLSDFLLYKLREEGGLINLTKGNPVCNRNRKIELFLLIGFISALLYHIVCASSTLSIFLTVQNHRDSLKESVKIKNRDNMALMHECESQDVIATKIQNARSINLYNVALFKIAGLEKLYLEELAENANKTYTQIRILIEEFKASLLNISESSLNVENIPAITEHVKAKKNTEDQMILAHNNITSSDNIFRVMGNLMQQAGAMFSKHKYESKTKKMNIVLNAFKPYSLQKTSNNVVIAEIVEMLIKITDKRGAVENILKIPSEIEKLNKQITVTETVSTIQELANLLEKLESGEVNDDIWYNKADSLLEGIKTNTKLDDDTYRQIKETINLAAENNIKKIEKLVTPVIGKLFEVKNKQIKATEALKDFESTISKLSKSQVFKLLSNSLKTEKTPARVKMGRLYVLQNIEQINSVLSDINGLYKMPVEKSLSELYIRILERICGQQFDFVLSNASRTVDLNEESMKNVLSEIISHFESSSEQYREMRNILTECQNRYIKESLKQIFTEWVKQSNKVLIRQNFFKESHVQESTNNNPIKELFNSGSVHDISNKMRSCADRLSAFSKQIESFVLFVENNRQLFMSEKLGAKLDFIYKTVVDCGNHQNDPDSSTINVMINELIELSQIEDGAIKTNNTLLSHRGYAGYLYSRFHRAVKKHTTQSIRKKLEDQIRTFISFIEENKIYPFKGSKEAKEYATTTQLEFAEESISDIIQTIEQLAETNYSLYGKVIAQCKKYRDHLRVVMEYDEEVSMGIDIDFDTHGIDYVSIDIDDDKTVLTSDNRVLKKRINAYTNINIEIPASQKDGVSFQQSIGPNFVISDNCTINIQNIVPIGFMFYGNATTSKSDAGNIVYRFSIPATMTFINKTTGEAKTIPETIPISLHISLGNIIKNHIADAEKHASILIKILSGII